MTRTVLVIGATGILAPAAAALVARGDRVIAVSRRGSEAGGDVAVDARDAGALASALEGLRWDDAIVYAPAATEASLGFVRATTPGRCVLVRVSRSADPARGILIVPRDTLQLGWRPPEAPPTSTRAERHGSVAPDPPAVAADRWHTPEEVSAAALAVLADGEPRTLGAVRPWSDKP